ncbi:hypothetical protein IGB42_04201 [Andreprevotia sp. IGB-42]|uniref:hypothetical protein n=1 Tax=Andreprevotia sp. IGB-42 TaxID=2497473 RepID=UPI001358188B|nr:hypothetical protein [Andreprevotia sp. IGB-42]KAF0811364.1 hypothetical protein IGB42_04201 [Andreprevotia sp. IGB-42]
MNLRYRIFAACRRLGLMRSGPHCPPHIERALLDVLYYTLLFIRHCENLRVAQVAASHVHNIPDLISNYSVEKLALRYSDRNHLIRVAGEERYEIDMVLNAWNDTGIMIEAEIGRLHRSL